MGSLCRRFEVVHARSDSNTDHTHNRRPLHPSNLVLPSPFYCCQLHVCIIPMAQRAMDARGEVARTSGPCTGQELPRIRCTKVAASATDATKQRLGVHKNMVLGLVSATSVAERTEAIHIAYTSVTYDANGFVSLKSDKRAASNLVGDVVVSPLHISAESLLH